MKYNIVAMELIILFLVYIHKNNLSLPQIAQNHSLCDLYTGSSHAECVLWSTFLKCLTIPTLYIMGYELYSKSLNTL